MSITVKEEQNLDQNVIQAVQALAEEINSNPDKADVAFRAESKLDKGLQSEINVREFEFVSDEPESLGGTNLGATPVEYVLAALAACQEIVIKAHGLALGINIKSVRVKATGNLDLHGFLNLSDDARPGFNDVNLVTEIETDETNEKKLKQLKEISFKNCPVLDIIENPVPVDGTVNFIN